MCREELIKEILEYKSTDARNSMSCSENWYSFPYAMKETFALEEIENMSEREIQLLYKLADNIQEGLY